MEAATSTESRLLIPFRVGDVWLGMEGALVREILSARSWVPIPGANASMPGVLPWRGRAIAVIDVGNATGVAERLSPSDKRPRNLIVETAGCVGALPVHGVREVSAVEESQLTRQTSAEHPLVSVEAQIDELLVGVLDVERLFEELIEKAKQ